MIAYLVDAVILGVVVFLVAALVSLVLGPMVSFDPMSERLAGGISVNAGRTLLTGLVTTVVGGVYFVGSWMLWRATLGQRLLRLQLWRSDASSRPTLVNALIRWLMLGVPFWLAAFLVAGSAAATLAVWLLEVLWAIVLVVTTARSRRGQGLHDRVAGTFLLKVPRTRVQPSPASAPEQSPETESPVPVG